MNASAESVEIPRLTGTDVFIQFQRLILCEDADGFNAGVHAVGQREIDDAILASKRYCGLSQILGKNTKTAATAACQQHRDYFLLR
jgi:hypothetical protein